MRIEVFDMDPMLRDDLHSTDNCGMGMMDCLEPGFKKTSETKERT